MANNESDDNTPSSLPIASEGETKYVKTRVLFGWIEQDELNGMFAGRLDPEDYINKQAIHQKMIQKVSSRSKYRPVSPVVENVKMWPDLDAIKNRSELQAIHGALKWDLKVLDLRRLIAFQKVVNLHGLDKRVERATMNNEAVLDVCIPLDDPELPSMHYVDLNGKAFTLSSPNPNFKIIDARIGDVDKSAGPGLPPFKTKAVSIFVGTMPSYVSVAKYKDRYYLRDGYHRAVGLLRAGINEAPCIIVEAPNANWICPPGNHLPQEVFLGDNPPFLEDFLDDSVSGEGQTIENLTIIRISGEEFAVNR